MHKHSISVETSNVNRESTINSHKSATAGNSTIHKAILSNDRTIDQAIDYYKQQENTTRESNRSDGQPLKSASANAGQQIAEGEITDQLISDSYHDNSIDKNNLSGESMPLSEGEKRSIETNQTSEQSQNIADSKFEYTRTPNQGSLTNNSVDEINNNVIAVPSTGSSNQEATIIGNKSSLSGPLALKRSEIESKDSIIQKPEVKEDHDIKSEKKKKNREPVLIPTSVDVF